MDTRGIESWWSDGEVRNVGDVLRKARMPWMRLEKTARFSVVMLLVERM